MPQSRSYQKRASVYPAVSDLLSQNLNDFCLKMVIYPDQGPARPVVGNLPDLWSEICPTYGRNSHDKKNVFVRDRRRQVEEGGYL